MLQEVIETILLFDDGDIRAQVFLVVAKKLATTKVDVLLMLAA